jgi:hypothetical protein
VSAQTVIAVVALLLAILSLLWQAWTYQRSGSRFTVEAAFGFLLPEGKGLVSYGDVPPRESFADRAPRTGQMVIICRVRNTGRLAGTVVAWQIATEGKLSITPDRNLSGEKLAAVDADSRIELVSITPGRNLFGENLPATVGADGRIQLVCDYSLVRDLADLASALGVRRTVRVLVETGGGKKIKSGPLTIP